MAKSYGSYTTADEEGLHVVESGDDLPGDAEGGLVLDDDGNVAEDDEDTEPTEAAAERAQQRGSK